MKSAAPGTLPSFRPEVMAAAQTAADGPGYAASLPAPRTLPPPPPQTAAFVSPTAAADDDAGAAHAAAGAGGDDYWHERAARRRGSVTGACSASARRPA